MTQIKVLSDEVQKKPSINSSSSNVGKSNKLCDCMLQSLNGHKPRTTSREPYRDMQSHGDSVTIS